MNKNSRGFAHILILIIALVAIGAIGYMSFQKLKKPTPESPIHTSSPTPSDTNNSKQKQEYSPSPQPQPVKINILPTTDWKTVSNNGITFKIPPYASCNNNTSCSLVSYTSEYNEREIPNNIDVDVQEYKGGSRREQFFDKYDAYSRDACNFIFVDSIFGNIKALQIGNDGGQCQGGGGGIVTVIGGKLIIFFDLNYNSDTGEIHRWEVRDTIVSTLSAN